MKTRNLFLSYPILCLTMLIFFSHKTNAQSQFYLSEIWNQEGGAMPVFYRTATTTDNLKNVYVVGATATDSSGYDIFIQKFDSKGDLHWEQTFDGGANLDDMGTDIFVDANYNVFVTGASTQNTTNNLDLVVLKYDENGDLEWSYFYNFGGSPIPYDGGTAITGDNSGGIYVTGASAGDTTMMDYVTLKLNDTIGSQIWVNRYDFTQMNEVPAKISLLDTIVIVTGASQISVLPTNSWELATVRYFSGSGDYGGEGRTTGSSTSGADEAHDLTIDNDGNIYVLGATDNDTTGLDISIYKFNDDLELLWEQHFDGYEGEDKGFGVKTDDAGNVYVVGYVTNPNQGKNYAILKYDSTGDLQWSREFNGLANQDDEAVQLVVREDRIFVTGAARNGTNSEITTMGYTAEGEIFSVKTYDSPFGLNDKPTDMGIDLDNNLIVVGQIQETDTTFRNVTVKYNIMEKPIVPVYVDSVPAYNDRELIVRFDRTAMNLDAVDKKNFDAGFLKDFVHEHVIDSLNAKFPFDAGRLQTFKIFHRMTTADSLSITRLGDTIPVPAFWATLSVMFPEEYDLFEAIDTLNTMKPMVHYGEVNGIIVLFDVPNDELIDEQSNLIPNLNFPDAHISIENAWDIEVGQTHTKVGVYDSQIFWAHEDFGDGTFQGSKIVGGWDFSQNVHISNVTEPLHPHGTAVAGIIGALRNNENGIAGIAGGDLENNNTGVQLFSMGIFHGLSFSSVTLASNAIIEGALQTINGFGYGLDIQNHSWGGSEESATITSAVETTWRNHCIFVAARGNDGNQTLNYPACGDDRMVINVGASGTNGQHMWGNHPNIGFANGDLWWRSSFGGNIDLIAPGTTQIVVSTAIPTIEAPLVCNNMGLPEYQCFNGTSAAAPHVAGVAALMHSKHHTSYGAPNNLATEDVEHILQNTATDVENDEILEGPLYPVGYDIWNGWGLLNAELALEAVNFPSFYVKHSGIVTPTVIPSYNQQVTIINTTNTNLATGQYNVDRYQVNWTYIDILPIGHEIIDWWPLEASTFNGVSAATPITAEPYMDVTPNVSIGSNAAVFSVMTFAWWVKTSNSGQTINKWIPSGGPNSLRYAYSLHVKDNTVGGLADNSNFPNVFLFPNPANDHVLLELSISTSESVKIEIFDAAGRLVAYPEIEFLETGTHSISINIGNLHSGLYHMKISSGNDILTTKFVKL